MDVEGFILELDTAQQNLMRLLQMEILAALPNVQEKIAYKIPFYYWYGPMVYLNPKGVGVDVGFTKGYLFRHGLAYLNSKNRKQVRSYFVKSVADYNPEIMLLLLYEAAEINKLNNGLSRS